MGIAHPRRPARPATRLHLRLDPALVVDDPRLGIGFGGKRADLCRVAIGNVELDGE